jgi:hypothetical protein
MRHVVTVVSRTTITTVLIVLHMVKKMGEWITTDKDNGQEGRQISEFVFEFRQDGIEMVIDLKCCTIGELNEKIMPYYDSLLQVFEHYGKKTWWIIAECVFEQDSGLY